MSLKFKKETVSSGVAVFSTVHETAIGGFTLDKTGLSDGDLLPAGSPIGYDESTRLARVIKTAVLHANAGNTATDYQVKKGHNFIVGEHFGAVTGGKAYTITAIDKSNEAYDVITIGTTLAVALTAGDVVFQSSAAGATAAAFIVTPKGLLFEETTVASNESVSVVVRGTVYARRAPLKNSYLRAALPLIIFSESY